MTPELIMFGVGADTAPAEAALSSLGDTADGVAVGLEDRLSGASDGLKDLTKGSTSASRGISGLGSMISVVDPKLGAVVKQVGSLTRGLQLLRVVSGPLAIAIGAVTTALVVYNATQEIAAQRAREAEERSQRLSDALERQAELTQDLQRETDLISGATDQYALSLEEEIALHKQAANEARSALTSQIRALKLLKEEQEDVTESGSAHAAVQAKAAERANELTREIAALRRERDRVTESEQENIRQATRNANARRREAEDTGTATGARNRHRDAIDAETAAMERQEKLKKTFSEPEEDDPNLQQKETALELSRQTRDAIEAVQTEEERINALYRDRMKLLDQAASLGVDEDQIAEARAAFERQHFEEMSALRRAEHDQTIAELNEQREKIADNIQGMTDLYSSASSLISDLAGLAAGEDEEAQARAAKLDKGLNIAGALIGGVVGVIVNTLLGNPVGAVSSGLGGASGVIRAASAHQGDRIAPDEEMVRTVILRDEKITPDARVISPEGSRRMERGEDGGAHTVAIPIYQHFGEFFADVVEGGGTPLHDLINQGRDVGRRRA